MKQQNISFMKIARTFQTKKRSELQDRAIFNLRVRRIVEKTGSSLFIFRDQNFRTETKNISEAK